MSQCRARLHCSCQSLKWLTAQCGPTWSGCTRACERLYLRYSSQEEEGEAQPLWVFCLFVWWFVFCFVLLFKMLMLEIIRGLGKVLPWGTVGSLPALQGAPGVGEAGVERAVEAHCACSLLGNWNYFGWGEQSK